MKKLIILTLMSLLSTLSFAQDFEYDKAKGVAVPKYVAELKLFKGKVFKVVNGEKKAVQVGTRFFKSDTIVTEDKTFAKLIVVDETVLNLGSNSELNFAEFKFADKNDRNAVYDLVRGQLTGHVKVKAKEGDLTVKTRTAVMGIRGTEIVVNHQSVNNIDVSEFALLSGSAEITDSKKQKFDMIKGNHLVVINDSQKKDSASEKGNLSAEQLKQLIAEGKDELTEFKPFMPYFDPAKLAKDSPLYAFLNNTLSGSDATSTDVKSKHSGPKQNWKDNLKKLNEELKKNRSKK